jgi:hypothetical protein
LVHVFLHDAVNLEELKMCQYGVTTIKRAKKNVTAKQEHQDNNIVINGIEMRQ